jgi:hypothetical protein
MHYFQAEQVVQYLSPAKPYSKVTSLLSQNLIHMHHGILVIP